MYTTDTYTYSETSTETDYAFDSVSLSLETENANDLYAENDTGTIVSTDTATTSFDSYALFDSHVVSGVESSVTPLGTDPSVLWYDSGGDTNIMYANGTNSTTGGTSTTFSDVDNSFDNYALTSTDPTDEDYDILEVASDTAYTTTIEGSVGSSSESSWYSYETISSEQIIDTTGGTEDGSTFGSYLGIFSEFDEYISSGPPPSTITVSPPTDSTSTSFSTYQPVEIVVPPGGTPGTADVVGAPVAESIGFFPVPLDGAPGGAIHNGTTPQALDTTAGPFSPIAGQILHPLVYSGAAIGLVMTPDVTIALREENETSEDFPRTEPWVSHPATIGYSREGTSHTAVAPGSDSGMNAGTPGDVVLQVESFGSGSAQNPTAEQSGPTSRAQQIGGKPATNGDPTPLPKGPYWLYGRDGTTPPPGWVSWGTYYGNSVYVPPPGQEPDEPELPAPTAPELPRPTPGPSIDPLDVDPALGPDDGSGDGGLVGGGPGGVIAGGGGGGSQPTRPANGSSPGGGQAGTTGPQGAAPGSQIGQIPLTPTPGTPPLAVASTPSLSSVFGRAARISYDVTLGRLLNPVIDLVQDTVQTTTTVWGNTAGQGMSTFSRGYTAVGTAVAKQVGVLGVSDAFAQHDAIDAHKQSWFERATKGLFGSVQLVATGFGIKGLFGSMAAAKGAPNAVLRTGEGVIGSKIPSGGIGRTTTTSELLSRGASPGQAGVALNQQVVRFSDIHQLQRSRWR